MRIRGFNWLEMMLWDAEGGGGGEGGSAPPPADGATPPADGGTPPASSGGDLYRPQGVPESIFGKSNNETIDNLVTALNSARAASRSTQVPETIDAYVLGEVPGEIQPFLSNLEQDQTFRQMQALALKNKLPVEGFAGFIKDLVGEWNQAGMFAPAVDTRAEREALIPDNARTLAPAEQEAAINARVRDNLDYVEKILTQKGMPKDSATLLVESLGDRAAGHKAIEFIRSIVDGQTSDPLVAGRTGGADMSSIERDMADPRYDPSSPRFDQRFHNQVFERWKRAKGAA